LVVRHTKSIFLYLNNLKIENMTITKEMRKVILHIWNRKIDRDLVSPNLVADIAYNIGLTLTSPQITYISDGFGDRITK
jgi:hypothetical protein